MELAGYNDIDLIDIIENPDIYRKEITINKIRDTLKE